MGHIDMGSKAGTDVMSIRVMFSGLRLMPHTILSIESPITHKNIKAIFGSIAYLLELNQANQLI